MKFFGNPGLWLLVFENTDITVKCFSKERSLTGSLRIMFMKKNNSKKKKVRKKLKLHNFVHVFFKKLYYRIYTDVLSQSGE